MKSSPASASAEVATAATSGTSADLSPPILSPGQIFVRFLRFGILAFGGPVAQIAMIRRELVDEERW